MADPLPHQWLSGADTPNSLAQQAQENFDALRIAKDQALGQAAGWRSGFEPVVWDGVTNVVVVTLTHNLGVVPLVFWSGSGAHYLNGTIQVRNSTIATIQVSNDGAIPSAGHSDDILWLAIG